MTGSAATRFGSSPVSGWHGEGADLSRAFHRTADWLIDHPRSVTALLVLISGLAVVGYVDPQLVTSSLVRQSNQAADHGAVASDEEFEVPPDVDPVSLSDAEAIIVVQSDEFFTPAGARTMRHVVETLESLDHVDSILWMDRVPVLNIFGLPEPLLPRSRASEQQFQDAKEKALAHPLVGGQLLSADAQTLLLLVRFDWLFVQSDEDCTVRLREVAESAAAEFPGVDLQFSVTGRVPMYVTAVETHERNQRKYQLIAYGMIGLMAVILFRGVAAVFIVALAPALGVFWTLGILRYFELQNNPFNDVVLPVLLSLVGFTDGVHLMVQIRRLRAAGRSGKEAAREGLRAVGLACLLTSVTTAIGFGSLSLAHHDVVREFGWSCVTGVLLTFVAVVTVIPLACSTRLGRTVHRGHSRGLIDRHLDRIGSVVAFVLPRSKPISILGIAGTVTLVLVSFSLRPDERNSNALPGESEAAQALRHMDQAMGGLEFSRVVVRWSGDVPSDSPEVLEVIREVDELLRGEELIGHPLSIRNLIDSLPGEGTAADRMSLLELLPPPLKRAFYTPEIREAIVTFRVQDLGIARYGPVFRRIEAGLAEIARRHPQFSLDLSGRAVWRWENLYQIVVDLAASLGSAAVIIFLVLMAAYRSLRMGIISIVPNVFPLAVTGTFLVLSGQALELVSVCAFTVCLGIAVDDTIHFLTRFEEERAKTDDRRLAIQRAFTGVGTALVMTTIILVAGFSTVLLSDSRDHRIFATMGGLTIASALFGDLVILPALLARFAGAKRSRHHGHDAAQLGPDHEHS